MTFKLSEREKMVKENTRKDGEDLNLPCFSPFHLQKTNPFLNRVPLQSPEYSPSSSSFSNGFCSSEDGSPYAAPPSEDAKHQTPLYHYSNGLCLDAKSNLDSHHVNGMLVDELDLCHNLQRMNVREEQNGGTKMKGFEIETDPHGFALGIGDDYLGGSVRYNTGTNGSYGGFNDGSFYMDGFQSSPRGVPLSFDDDMKCRLHVLQGGFEKGVCEPRESFFAHYQPHDLCSGSGWYKNQSDCLLEQRKEQGRCWNNRGSQLQNPSSTVPDHLNDAFVWSSQYKMDCSGGRGRMDPFRSSQLNVYDPLYEDFLLKETNLAVTRNKLIQSLMHMEGAEDMEALNCEDSFIIDGKVLNYFNNEGPEALRVKGNNSFNDISVQELGGQNIKLDNYTVQRGICENDQRLRSYSALPSVVPGNSSLGEVQDYIYLMAQDQNGCRFLQKILEKGTSEEIQIIFNELIHHVFDLMVKPFGNYVIQKFLDVCNEEQRLKIVLLMTNEPGPLVRTCSNIYGTRVVQKLIEKVKTRQQISLVILALKPALLDLIKDQNGSHVIQRCLQYLDNEDNKFIFDVAAKFCVEIATHRHGCCVMQRCIGNSSGKHGDKLITQVCKHALLLAQDPFGNYVVQYVIEQKSPSTIASLLSQFEGHYKYLSMQKFSSHVVEKCLNYFEESRPQIVHELLSMSPFERLLQDPYANYVIQSALAVTKGLLHSLLVEAVKPHMILRTSPFCKKIFSRNLLRK